MPKSKHKILKKHISILDATPTVLNKRLRHIGGGAYKEVWRILGTNLVIKVGYGVAHIRKEFNLQKRIPEKYKQFFAPVYLYGEKKRLWLLYTRIRPSL